MNSDPEISVQDRQRFNTAFERQHATVIAANDFQTTLDSDDTTFTPDDAGDFDAWWTTVRAEESFRGDNPTSIIGTINKVGFMTENMVRGVWATVLNGETEEAQGILTRLSALRPDVLSASFSREQHEQYTYWKHDRKARTQEDTILGLRSFHDGAPTQIRDQLEREYGRLIVDSDFTQREEIFDKLDVEDAPENSFGLGFAHRDFLETHRQFFLQGMDWDDAEEAAVEMVRRDWGHNIDGRAMYLPPALARVPVLFDPEEQEFNYAWIKRDLEATIRAPDATYGVPEDSDIRLFADETARRQRNGRQQISYLIQYEDESGVLQFLTQPGADGSHRLMRYVPKPPDAMVQQQGADLAMVQQRYQYEASDALSP